MRAGRGAITALLVSASVAACTGVSTDPETPVSLQFDSLPALAVVVGDTMRGGDLLPARVPVRAFNGSGSAVSDGQLRLLGIDTTSVKAFEVISDLRLVGKVETPAVRIVAQSGSLQSQTQTFAVVPPPTGIVRTSAAGDSIVYDRPDTAQRFRDVGVNVIRQVAPESTLVSLNGLRVQFRVVSFSALLDSVRLVGTGTGRNATSAIVTGGTATIRLKAYTKAGTTGQSGMVVLQALHRSRGAEIRGSPLTITVRLVPFTL